MRVCVGLLSAAFALAASANAALITNGDFSAGDTSGYAVAACGIGTTAVNDAVCGFSNVIDPSQYIYVNQNGADDYLQLDTGFGILFGSVTQSLNITANSHLFSFDAGVIGGAPGFGSDIFPDKVTVGVRNSVGNFLRIFSMTENGFTAYSENGLTASLTAASGGFFGTGVVADLSSLIGLSTLLEIQLFSELDGRNVSFALDNFALTGGSPSEVPGPASLALFATGLIFFRRRLRWTT